MTNRQVFRIDKESTELGNQTIQQLSGSQRKVDDFLTSLRLSAIVLSAAARMILSHSILASTSASSRRPPAAG